jgi:hypothetical protein
VPRPPLPCAARPQPVGEKARDREEEGKEEKKRKKKNGAGKIRKIGNKKIIIYF